MRFDALKRLFAEIMLNLAGIFGRSLAGNPEPDEEIRQQLMALKHPPCDLFSGGKKRNQTIVFHRKITVLAQLFHRDTDAWLGNAERPGNVNRANLAALLRKQQNGFQIILRRLINLRSNPTLRK